MAGTQEKIQLLLRIAHQLNAAGVEWALGASMLLYFKGITSCKSQYKNVGFVQNNNVH